MIRFMHIFNYAEGVSETDGENWYLHTHVPHIKKLPGIVRYRSWKQWETGLPFPSFGLPSPFNQFVRRTELCFADTAAGIKIILENSRLFASSSKGNPGFREFECMFLEDEPEYNLLQDTPPQHYKYISLQLMWPKGLPSADPNEDIFIDTYFFQYIPGIPWSVGEDWYLGHHTREGKQLPGMRHYRTWRVVHIKDLPVNLPIKPNRWARLTELGMGPNAFKATMIDDATRVRFTPSPVGPGNTVINWGQDWRNVSIKLDQYEDLLK